MRDFRVTLQAKRPMPYLQRYVCLNLSKPAYSAEKSSVRCVKFRPYVTQHSAHWKQVYSYTHIYLYSTNTHMFKGTVGGSLEIMVTVPLRT